ncbi:alpha/beta hydrolase [Sphingomonas bacterium]|uniref:alpha/beta hydrolase n=1 Tax=Sphingomonas bacterium TaxID=1895847 RepID=UPI001575F101|nr:alpha/beta hydrolase [Sphingomonas bacterium]
MPGALVATEAQAAPPASAPLQCRTYNFGVKQFSTDIIRQSVWGQLCFRGQLTSDTPVQLLIHGGAYNHTYWDSPFKPEVYSYVQAATKRGYATLNIDRLGYGQSDHPVATTLNFDVAGYITHQLVQTLRGGALGVRFTRVILNGHSMGALTAENEAANYHDVDGLIVSGIGHNLNPPPEQLTTFTPAATDPKFVGQLALATYLTSRPNVRISVFVSGGTYDPAIPPYEEGILKDTLSPTEFTALPIDTNDQVQLTQKITAPVLFAQGRYDKIWCTGTFDCQTDPQALKEPTYWQPGVFTRVVIPDAGHSINSNLSAPTFYETTFTWLAQHGLAPR